MGSPLTIVIDADGNQEQKFDAILEKKKEGRRVLCLVRFDGDSDSEAIWKPKSEL